MKTQNNEVNNLEEKRKSLVLVLNSEANKTFIYTTDGYIYKN